MRRKKELLKKWAVERVQDLETGFLFPAISCPQKECKVMSCNRFFSVESIYKATTIHNKDSQVSMAINTSE